jgi:ubiquinone/menaquinone biosynthesis C-methylase UbiE/uncharacterized protein YbaR (Trm112 family)
MSRLLKILLAIPLGLACFWLVVMKIISRVAASLGVSGPCPTALSWLVDNPIRRHAVPRLLDWAGIRPGERVLELGPGPGAFTVEAGRRAGPQGRLIAVDIQPAMIAQVEARVRQAGLTNVEPHVASAHSLPLPAASVDRVFLITVLGEIPDPDRALAELYRVLAPGGVLSVGEAFLDPDYPFPAETIRRVEAAGFRLIERHGNFWEYALNFRRVTVEAPAGMEVMACPACHAALEWREAASVLRCAMCARDYPVRQGIPHFVEPATLTGLNRRFARLYDWFSWFYRLFSKVAFAYIGMPEEAARRELLDRLEPGGGRVLEVSIGPGVNLPYLVGRPDVGEVHGLDISQGQLRRCQAYLRRQGWTVPLYLGNAEELPFGDATFDAVFHIGGINFFNDKAKAIAEMVRVAKPGARIIICDENERGARAYERTLPGFKRSFQGVRRAVTAPVDAAPPGMLEMRVFDVWKGWMYCLEFRKPAN